MPSKLISTNGMSARDRDHLVADPDLEQLGCLRIDAQALARQLLDRRAAGAEILQPPGRDQHFEWPALGDFADGIGARLANRSDLVGGRGDGRSAVKNVDVA